LRAESKDVRRVICLFLLVALGAPAAKAEGSDKQFSRVRGTLQYQLHRQDPFRDIAAQLNLPDDAVAVTLADSQGLLRLPDSSEIDVGSKARFRVGAFSSVVGKPNIITLELGAMHFIVRHPQGARANYVFITPTSQIAVRGTEGYIVTGPKGTDFYCGDCSEGDVTLRTGTRSIPLTTGWQVIIVGDDSATANTTVIKEPCVNPAAIAVSSGKLGRTVPQSQWVDTTGSLSGDPLKPVNMTPPRSPATPSGYSPM
jgi:FecR protein